MKILKRSLFCLFLSLAGVSASAKDFTYDIGLATGSTQGHDFLEYHFGLNYHMLEWLAWRNSFFYQSIEGADSRYGLDSTGNLLGNVKLTEDITWRMNAGAGYRLLSAGKSAPLIEGGTGFNFGGLSLGAGAKIVLNSLVDSSAKDDVIYTIQFGGQGAF